MHEVVPFLAFGVGFQRTVRGGNGGWGRCGFRPKRYLKMKAIGNAELKSSSQHHGSGSTTLNYDWNYEYICKYTRNLPFACDFQVCPDRLPVVVADDWILGNELNDPCKFTSNQSFACDL